MLREKAILRLNDEKQYHINKINGVVYKDRTEAVDMGIKALELIGHLNNRPCEACEYHDEDGCHVWTCVFDEMIYEKHNK